MEEDRLTCTHCGKQFQSTKNKNRHVQTHVQQKHTCVVCGKAYGRADNLRKHQLKQHTADFTPIPTASQPTKRSALLQHPAPPKQRKRALVHYDCSVCGAQYDTIVALNEHFKSHVDDLLLHGREPLMEQALHNAVKVVTFFGYGELKKDLLKFFGQKKYEILHYLLGSDGLGTAGVRWFMCVGIKYYRTEKDGTTSNMVCYHNSKAKTKLRGEAEENVLHDIHVGFNHIQHLDGSYQERGSEWKFQEVESLKLYMGKYRPLRGTSYLPLPEDIKSSHCILNIKNKDEKCFLWSILAHLHEVPTNCHGNRVQKYKPYESEVNMREIPYPVPLTDIPKFEKQNCISVNVFGYDNGYYPLHISKVQDQKQHHVNLLLIEQGGNRHYCLIKNLNGMLQSQTKHHGKKFFCTYCLHGFCREDLLMEHKPYCHTHGLQHTVLPSQHERIMEFKNIAKMLKVPFVIYADFECLLTPGKVQGQAHEHQPCGYSYLIISTLPDCHFQPTTYSGPNVLEHFFHEILEDGDFLAEWLKKEVPISMTQEDEFNYRQTASCHICGGPAPPQDKVRDHCHLTGQYRGPAHKQCNLAYRVANFIPVLYHNLEGYDSHLLMQQLGKYKDRKLQCISKNMEKYISFSLGPLRFLDSLSFMNESLSSLVKNLKAADDKNLEAGGVTYFQHIHKHYPDPQQRELLLRKGVYPYEWMDDESKMTHTSLPPIEDFYSSLTMQGITEEDYRHAHKVWDTFNMSTMRDYHDLYLKSDVLLLADCFENFRDKCLQYYGLDPPHYYTAPGLSWDAALKMTDVNLELLTDIDMHLMMERGVRGGVSTISTRYAKANNKYMCTDYDETLPSTYLLDLDANNLYGWAMGQPLPTEGFKWMSQEAIQELAQELRDIPVDNPKGYILEVDLDIPVELHDHFNQYVPAPEHIPVTEDMLSPFNKMCQEKLGLKHTPCTKLIPNLHNKHKYVIHYRTLQCYLDLGLKLTHIHRVIEFQQRAWLKKYIDFNTDKRKKASNNFEKNFFKLMNNSVFGKVSVT